MRLPSGRLGTALTSGATRVLFLGAGELGKEVILELQRYGVEVIAVDRYANAPGMQVAHHSRVLDMRDPIALRQLLYREQPDLVVPEIEAIATDVLVELEKEGFNIIPSAKAVHLTMNRKGIRTLAAEKLGLSTSPYQFAASITDYRSAVASIGLPCVVKPVMSSSGKGQSLVRQAAEVDHAWEAAVAGARGGGDEVIVEGFVDFDYEITLLTVRSYAGDQIQTQFCEPIGHRQEGGDYQESWQPQPMSHPALTLAQDMALQVTDALGGVGLFGVEFFVKEDSVWFSEVSPRPHDTGLVTLISQDLSEFALHARAILGLPIANITNRGAAASRVILAKGNSNNVSFTGLAQSLAQPDTQLRLFGKPEVRGERRMGVALALGDDIQAARAAAAEVAESIQVHVD